MESRITNYLLLIIILISTVLFISSINTITNIDNTQIQNAISAFSA